MPKVYFTKELTKDNIDKLFDLLEAEKAINPKDFVALKVHFGETGNTAYLKPEKVRPIVERLQKFNNNLFFTDTNTLYKGTRADSVAHIKTAHEHGYDFLPVIIADGLHGHEFHKVKINQENFKEVYVGAAIEEADAMIVLSHFKGHEVAGFGGAIKNLSMGCASRAGKQQMHADLKPQVNESICTACGNCIKWCPQNTIHALPNKKARIDLSKCIGCAECVVACKFGAIAINWSGSPNSLQEKMTEYALGAAQNKKDKVIYFNFLLEISPNCDCYGFNDPPVVPDIGILASRDPVALDQASIDLVNEKSGKDIFRQLHNVDWQVQLNYAEKIGLGKKIHTLMRI